MNDVKQLVQRVLAKDQVAIKEFQRMIQMAQQGDPESIQNLKDIETLNSQGDPEVKQLMQLLQAESNATQPTKQALGGKLRTVQTLLGKCPEGYEMEIYKKGGKVCSRCKKMAEGSMAEKPQLKAKDQWSQDRKVTKAKNGKELPYSKKDHDRLIEEYNKNGDKMTKQSLDSLQSYNRQSGYEGDYSLPQFQKEKVKVKKIINKKEMGGQMNNADKGRKDWKKRRQIETKDVKLPMNNKEQSAVNKEIGQTPSKQKKIKTPYKYGKYKLGGLITPEVAQAFMLKCGGKTKSKSFKKAKALVGKDGAELKNKFGINHNRIDKFPGVIDTQPTGWGKKYKD